jgi:hypothetical protein
MPLSLLETTPTKEKNIITKIGIKINQRGQIK